MAPRGFMPVCLVLASLSGPLQAGGSGNTPTRQASRIEVLAHVREASQRFGIPADWIHEVIRAESGGRVQAVSSAGAMGLMQLMPGTWARQRDRFGLGNDPFDPRDNILAGTSYLREMYDLYGVHGFLAAYNAGPGRYEEWLRDGRPLPLETRRYVAGIAQKLRPVSSAAAAMLYPGTPDRRHRQVRADAAIPASGSDTPALPANPFARSAQPAHDLFAPVSAGPVQ